jgi:thioredoxin-related protein
MKLILLILLLITAGCRPRLVWHESLEKGIEIAKRQKKKIVLLYFYCGKESPASRRFERGMLNDPEVINLLAKFVKVRIDIDTYAGSGIGSEYAITKVPCIVLIDTSGKEVSRIEIGGMKIKDFCREIRKYLKE